MIWDRATLVAPRRAIVWQDRRTADICTRLREQGHEQRVTELTGLRLDPYFTATKLTWLAEHEPALWAGVTRRLARRRHGGLVPDRPADRGPAPRHGRVQRVAHAAVRHRGRAVVRRAVPAVRRPAARAARGGARRPAWWRTPTRTRSSACRCRSPGIAGDQQAAMFGQACFSPGVGEVHVRDRVVRAVQHRHLDRPLAGRAAVHGGLDGRGRGADLCARRIGVRDRRRRAVAARRARPARQRRAERGAGALGARLGRRGVRAGADRARRAVLGPGRARGDVRPDPGDDPGAPGPRRAGGDRVRGARRRRPDGRVRRPGSSPREARCGSTAARAPTTCSCRCRPTSSRCRSSGPWWPRPPRSGAAFLAGLATGVWSSPAELAAAWQLDRRFSPGATGRAGLRVVARGRAAHHGLGPCRERAGLAQGPVLRGRVGAAADLQPGAARPGAGVGEAQAGPRG